jgi:hypothetical protein
MPGGLIAGRGFEPRRRRDMEQMGLSPIIELRRLAEDYDVNAGPAKHSRGQQLHASVVSLNMFTDFSRGNWSYGVESERWPCSPGV